MRSKFTSIYTLFILVLFAILFLGFFNNPPNGNTGAPGDGLCTNCHSPGNPNGFDGEVIIDNFPTVIIAGTEYSLTARVTNPNGFAVRAGFQAVVLDGSNNNTGDLMVSGSNPTTTTSGGREYVEHNPGLNFPGSNEVTWDFTWTAPTGPDGMIITIWAAGNITNGNGNSSGDFVVTTNVSGVLDATNMPLEVEIISSTNVSCNGGNDGAASAAASGGTGPYTYLWSNNETGPTASNLTAGIQTVTVTDDLAATATASVTISEPPLLEASIVNQTNITCNTATGSATAQGSGGTPPYFYNWPSGGTNATENGLSAGSHTVTVTDNNFCIATATVFILEDITPPIVNAGPNQQLNCNVSVVILDGSESTSGPTYVYQWTTFDGLLCGGENTPLASACAPGTYTLTVTCTENGCSATDVVVVTEIPEVSLSISGMDVSCFGGNDGSIDLTVSGGQGPFDYDWDDDSLDGIEDPNGLAAGTYCVTVTDNVDCTDFTCVTIGQPAEIAIEFIQVDVTCFDNCDGSIDLNVTGGVFPYSYNWSNGDMVEDPTGLCADDYTVTVTDNNDCTATETITITQPDEIIITGTVSNATCSGLCDGAINLSVEGGTPSYTFQWTGPNGFTETSQNINGLCAGEYTVSVTDDNNCTATSTITVGEAPPLEKTCTVENTTCNAVCDGTIDITLTGGTPPYSFVWDNNLPPTEDQDSLCAGTYSVTVTDDNGCTSVITSEIGEPAEISGTAEITNADCNGSCDGSIDLTVEGGTPGYTYLWSTNSGEEDILGLCAGEYSVTVTDANGCSGILTFTVNEPSSITITLDIENTTCNGSCDGSITATPSGGTGLYTYTWNTVPQQNSQTVVNLCAGDYEVTVSDENGCTETITGTVTEPAPIETDANITNVTCNGQCDGAIDITVTGGTSPYIYDWGGGTNSEDLTDLCAGLFTVVVTDDNGCTTTASFTVDEPSPLEASATTTDVNCNGGCDGAVNVTVSGGTAPYSYDWSGPCEGANPMDVCAGNFTVTITDANGCTISLDVTINEPAPLEVSSLISPILCNGDCNGSIDITVSGGTTPYSYMWSTNSGEEDVLGLCAGTYMVTVTDANDCEIIETYTITEPPAITLSVSSTNETANGANDGTATATPSGGTGSFTYIWNDPLAQITQTATGLEPGLYCVTVTDENNCTAEGCVTVNPFDCDLEVSVNISHVLCNGEDSGSATTTVSGGTEPYSYNWSTGGELETETNIPAGSHSLTVTDANDCVVIEQFTITEPTAIEITETITNTTCGECNGSIDLTVSGGTPGYSFSWSNDATTEDIDNLCAGSYAVTITDANNCEIMQTFAVGGSSNLLVSITATNETTPGANDGTAMAIPSSENPPYVYEWSNGSTTQSISGLSPGEYCVTVTDDAGCTATNCVTIASEDCNLEGFVSTTDPTCFGGDDGEATATIAGGVEPYTYNWSSGGTANPETGLVAGVYTVTITDAENCTFTTTFIIGEPEQILISASVTDVSCNGLCDGIVNLTVTGGSPPYAYEWSGPCEGPNPVDVCAGTFTVTVTDTNGCSSSLDVTINEPEALELEAALSFVLCSGDCNGSIDLSVTGGTDPYIFEWSTGSGEEDILGLCAGSYSVLVIDNNGCTAEAVYAIVEPTALDLTISSTNETAAGANDGTATANASEGTPGYTYLWDNGETTPTITGLSPGDYCVTVTDLNGCKASLCTTIFPFGCNIDLFLSGENFTCPGDCNGTIDLTVTGGAAPLTYIWSNGSTDEDPTDLCVGTYTVIVTDDNGCTETASAIVMESPAMELELEFSGSNCEIPCSGMIDLTVTGGGFPFNFQWFDGTGTQISTNEDLLDVCPGFYTLIVTDANDCTATESLTIDEPEPINATTSVEDASCFGACDGSIDVEVTGGIAPYNFTWSGGLPPIEDQNSLCASTYGVTITDSEGCSIILDATIAEPMLLEVIIVATADPDCFGECNGSAAIAVSGGTLPYVLSGPTEDLCAGTYTTTVTDANDCTAIGSFIILEPPEFVVDILDIGDEMETMMDGFIETTPIGGIAPYTFTWLLDDVLISTDEDPTGLSGGLYVLIATDANGCEYTDSVFVDNIVAISQIQLNHSVKVFPNPTSEMAYVKFDLPEIAQVGFDIYDFTGRLIYAQQELNVFNQLIPLDLSNFSDGIYTIKIKVDDVFMVKKIVKYSW